MAEAATGEGSDPPATSRKASGDPPHPYDGQITIEQVIEPAAEILQMRCVHVSLVGVHALPVLVEIEQGGVLDALMQVVVDVPLFLPVGSIKASSASRRSCSLPVFARMWAITVKSSGRESVGAVTGILRTSLPGVRRSVTFV